MENFEKLGAFYLGRPYDLKNKKARDGILLYDSADLVTHAVCVGMTGSGKTGLCIAMLEEAAIDGIPSIVIDPKGDIANLLLTFPELRGEDFRPWVNEQDAQKNGLSADAFASAQADLWKKGLDQWGQDGERIRRLKDAAEFCIYTPGSTSGLQVSILKSFGAPPREIREDKELMTERVNSTVTSLLNLIGIEADPIKSREHVLISTLLNRAWSAGQDLDVAGLIQQIQSPPVTQIGVMQLDSFFLAKDRFELAMALNNLLGAPAFGTWMEGEPLEIQKILYTPTGKPRVAIFSIAHLDDTQRMFFVSLLLNQILAWVRTQSGTTSLRAILYMDEIFGYFPPVANPPSKFPLLTLLKQGRAFGFGVVLATQNPVDLDYKGLSNTGTWLIGRLQTERDKARVLEGLEGIAGGSGQKFDRQVMEQTLAGLSSRVFLLNNVHEDAVEIFESRWAMSYLRGPLTRPEIKKLMDPVKEGRTQAAAPATAAAPVSSPAAVLSGGSPRSILPSEIAQYFIPVRSSGPGGATLMYHPMLFGAAEVRYSDSKSVDFDQQRTQLWPITDGAVAVDWDSGSDVDIPVSDLEKAPEAGAAFAEAPATAGKAKNFEKWQKELASWLYRNQRLDLFESRGLHIASNPGESERDFRIRLQQLARERRDAAVEQLRQKYAPKIAALREHQSRAQQVVEREAAEAKNEKLQTAISIGATLLSSFMGRKSLSLSTLGRATTAARGVSRSTKESQDVGRAEERVENVSQKLADLDAQFKAEVETLEKSVDPLTEAFDKVSLKPTKSNIAIKFFSLAWAPYWHDGRGGATPAW
jgi:hypothetical protein